MNSFEPIKTGHDAETPGKGMQGCLRYTEISRQLKDICNQNEDITYTECDKVIRVALADVERKRPALCRELKKKEHEALLEYKGIIQTAREKYLKIKYAARNLSLDEYVKMTQPALSEYSKVEQAALDNCKKKIENVLSEYRRRIEPFLFAWVKSVSTAKAEYKDKSQTIHDKYEMAKREAWLEFCSEHKEKIRQYFEKWLAIGLRTESLKRENALSLIKAFYRELGKKEPEIIISDSPLSCLHRISSEERLSSIEWDPRWGLKTAAVMDEQRKIRMGLPIGSEISKQRSFGIKSQIEWLVEPRIKDHIRSGILTRLQELISSQIGNHLESIRNETSNWLYGNNDCHWAGYYEFYRDVFGFKSDEPVLFEIFIEITKELHWFLPYEEVCIVSDFPIEIHRNQSGLHKDGAPALLYKDGMSIWALNGVRVGRRIAETPADKLAARLLLKGPNNDIRREIVRKIGIERICRDLGAKSIDSEKNYELMLLDIGERRKLPYLKMLNPSIGIYHIEGVPPGTKTVKQAIFWRNQSDEQPDHLT